MSAGPYQIECGPTCSASHVRPVCELKISLRHKSSMSLIEAFKGAQVELSQAPDNSARLRLCNTYIKILGQQLLGTFQLLPYGFRAFWLHKRLPAYSACKDLHQIGVRLLRNQRYGREARNGIDVYIPPGGCSEQRPVAIFCHGGVWSIGERWQYSPIATSLAREGIVTCVLEHTLYPKALVPQMVDEVSAALDWTLQHAPKFGGSPEKLTLVGHSAGAQLWMMALLRRAAKWPHKKQKMPACFVGMAGAYDIGRHFEYEKARGVAFLSTMSRAVGGQSEFDQQSPAVILRESAIAAERSHAAEKQPKRTLASQLKLRGQRISQKLDVESNEKQQHSDLKTPVQAPAAQEVSERSISLLNEHQLLCLPPVYLMSNGDDITVPSYQSSLLEKALESCGCNVDHRTYANVQHAGFAIDWQVDSNSMKDARISTLRPFAQDLISIIKSQ